MEYGPWKTAAYLAGKIDEYVKQQARDTIMQNVSHDRFARYARIPDAGACEFCQMLGSRGFVYHSEESAGGEHNDYHPHCNCQIAVSFDPQMVRYYMNGTTVSRGYDMSGRYDDRYDIDALYLQYVEAGKSYKSSSRYADYAATSKLAASELAAAKSSLAEARTLDELHDAGKRIVDDWKPGRAGRDSAQWKELSAYAQKLEKEMQARSGARNAAYVPFDGSFGRATAPIRATYMDVKDAEFADKMTALFNQRNRAMLDVEGDLSRLGKANLASVFSGIEHGGAFVGTDPSRVKLVSTKRLSNGALAQAERRGKDIVLRLNTNRLRGMSQDQVEQIVFHEMAHTVEYRMVTDAQFAREAAQLADFQKGARNSLPLPAASKKLEKALEDAGIQARYVPNSGKIEITGNDADILFELPEYAWDGADKGTQDSELIAESIRYVANSGYGRNRIADIIVRTFLGG